MVDLDSLTAALRASAAQFGAKPCLVSPSRCVSFTEFTHNVAAVADCYKDLGVGLGDRVAILDVDSVDYLECLYGLAAIGAIAVPLNYRQRVGELQYQVQNSGSRLLLANRRYTKEADELRPYFLLGWLPIDEFCERARQRASTSDAELVGVDGRTPFSICYTSGTTGRPKGAVIEQRAACLRALRLIIEFGIRGDDVIHVMTPLFHISALIVTLIGIMRGATVLVLPQFELEATMRALRRHQVTFVSLVPTMLAMMRKSSDFAPGYFGHIRLIMYAGAPMNPQLLRDVRSIYEGDFVQSFGQTEDLPQLILTAENHREAFSSGSRRLESVGRPPIGVELKICDGEGRALPPGKIGEIASRGGTAMNGYWQLPQQTAEVIRDGWVFSGDLGSLDSDGYVYLAGRKRHMIIRGGENIYPAEVERVLLTFPGVRDAVVVGLPDPIWGELVVAVVVPEAAAPEPAAVLAHCKRFLASYRCPDRICFREQLPYNVSGKVDRSKLRLDFEQKSLE